MTDATDNRTTELLPCPFCGGEAELRDDGETGYPFSVQCIECGGMTCGHLHADTPFGAIAAWNARAERTCRNVADEWAKTSFAHAETSFCCSECGAHYVDCEAYYAGLADADDEQIRTNWCPNCGAKVVGE